MEREPSATAIQCWTALEEFYGVVPCTLMSMMSNSLLPSACEADIAGLVGMYVLQAASEQPAPLLDWNNKFGDDPNKDPTTSEARIAPEAYNAPRRSLSREEL